MTYSSVLLADTGESLSNVHSERGALPCKMLLPSGEEFLELSYAGYMVFGGQCYFATVAMLNGLNVSKQSGLDCILKNPQCIKPRIVSADFCGTWADVADNKRCKERGYFYPKKSSRGGMRKGAGRKACADERKRNKIVTVYMTAEEVQKVKTMAFAEDKKVSSFICDKVFT